MKLNSRSEVPNEPNVLKNDIEVQPVQRSRVLHSSDLLPNIIKDRNIDGIILQTGLIANIPDGSSHVKAYFATDENKLYIFNNVSETWKSITLT